jgi:hypothetical protein
MLVYFLICLSLSLLGIAGLQMMYMFYLDRIDKERKKRINELERHAKALSTQLSEAEDIIAEQRELLAKLGIEEEEEIWADVIDDR